MHALLDAGVCLGLPGLLLRLEKMDLTCTEFLACLQGCSTCTVPSEKPPLVIIILIFLMSYKHVDAALHQCTVKCRSYMTLSNYVPSMCNSLAEVID